METKKTIDEKELCLFIDNAEHFYNHKIELFDYYAKKFILAPGKDAKKLIDERTMALRLISFRSLTRMAAKNYCETFNTYYPSKDVRHKAAEKIDKEFHEYYNDVLIAEMI